MVSFLTSSKMAAATLLAMTASTDAYRITYQPAFPTLAVRRVTPSSIARQSFFPRDIGRMMDDIDELFDSMMGDISDMFYDPSPFHRISRPSYFLNGLPAAGAPKPPVNTYSITQDEKLMKLVVTVPGAEASDVKLDLDEDNRILRISGETKREYEGISSYTRFEKSFTLDRNLDVGGINAEMSNGVLTITAPKLEEVTESVRRIDIIDNSGKKLDHSLNDADADDDGEKIADVDTEVKAETTPEAEENKAEDDLVIDLDESKVSP